MTEEDDRRKKLEADEAAILMKLGPRFDSAAAGYAWYSTEPVSGFSGRTAMQLVSEGRAEEVLR
jgi:hypothetical protein